MILWHSHQTVTIHFCFVCSQMKEENFESANTHLFWLTSLCSVQTHIRKWKKKKKRERRKKFHKIFDIIEVQKNALIYFTAAFFLRLFLQIILANIFDHLVYFFSFFIHFYLYRKIWKLNFLLNNLLYVWFSQKKKATKKIQI